MPIVYDKLLEMLKARGLTTYFIRTTGFIGNATYHKLKHHTGGLSPIVLDRVCESLNAQPGELMEYITVEEFRKRYGVPPNEPKGDAGAGRLT